MQTVITSTEKKMMGISFVMKEKREYIYEGRILFQTEIERL